MNLSKGIADRQCYGARHIIGIVIEGVRYAHRYSSNRLNLEIWSWDAVRKNIKRQNTTRLSRNQKGDKQRDGSIVIIMNCNAKNSKEKIERYN